MLVAGSRCITNYSLVVAAIEESGFEVTEVLSGGACGVDRLGERFADGHGRPVAQIKPDWSRGRHAGLPANSELAVQSEATVIARQGTTTDHAKCQQGTHLLPRFTKKSNPSEWLQ